MSPIYVNLTKLKFSFASVFLLCSAATLHADEPVDSVRDIVKSINSTVSTTITINQPTALDERIAREKSDVSSADENDGETERTESDSPKVQTGQHKVSGYRIQVYSDSNAQKARNQAYAIKRNIESAFSAYRCYVIFNSPYWRVKVGDFKSKSDADAVAVDIKRRFPAMAHDIRVVRDRINAK